MKYWIVTVFNSLEAKDVSFGMLAPKGYKVKKLRETLRSVHPEFERIRLKSTKRPDTSVIFREGEIPPKKIVEPQPPEEEQARKIGFAS